METLTVEQLKKDKQGLEQQMVLLQGALLYIAKKVQELETLKPEEAK